MKNEQKSYVEPGGGDPRAARTKDNAIGIDDIGLPSDVVPDNASKVEEITPAPEKIERKT
ncbi:hypothetical protein [Noviherbaspirillum autotrophicum]|uniref:Uncharacterized protein n=1 Tax=Noviherbaspirillum autotrophicum TaxID=709839 RepID=A0A0C1Y7Q5_9BURK|nr:hypothetical protein [Noviherbaspirillum autotrophicum]KIF82903.1 hypothetical protein TSA66_22045 [Noviherbaspirillum autotrophicum]